METEICAIEFGDNIWKKPKNYQSFFFWNFVIESLNQSFYFSCDASAVFYRHCITLYDIYICKKCVEKSILKEFNAFLEISIIFKNFQAIKVQWIKKKYDIDSPFYMFWNFSTKKKKHRNNPEHCAWDRVYTGRGSCIHNVVMWWWLS